MRDLEAHPHRQQTRGGFGDQSALRTVISDTAGGSDWILAAWKRGLDRREVRLDDFQVVRNRQAILHLPGDSAFRYQFRTVLHEDFIRDHVVRSEDADEREIGVRKLVVRIELLPEHEQDTSVTDVEREACAFVFDFVELDNPVALNVKDTPPIVLERSSQERVLATDVRAAGDADPDGEKDCQREPEPDNAQP